MNNSTTTIKIKDKFARIQANYAGHILLHNWGDPGSAKSLGITQAFTPLDYPIDSSIPCECGHSVWNATNFGNLIHFCPNREYTFELTDYYASCH